MSRPRQPIDLSRGNEPVAPEPIIIPEVDITQASVHVMSFGSSHVEAVTVGETAWTTLTLAAGLTEVTDNKLRYRKDGMGFVHIQGAIRRNVAGTFTGTIATLPAGYRPGGNVAGSAYNQFQHLAFTNAVAAPFNFIRLTIEPDGDIIGNYGIANGEWVEFNHCSFYAEN